MPKFSHRISLNGMVFNDPTKTLTGGSITTSAGDNGIFNRVTDANTIYTDPYYGEPTSEDKIKKLQLENKLLKLRLLALEGRFTQEEVVNIRKMIMSEDEASRVLAETIIDNA